MAFQDTREQKKLRSREELLKHLEEFRLDLKFSVGVWYFSPGGGRFHDRYVPEMSIPERLEVASGFAKYGVKGIEAHYPTEVNDENYQLYKRLENEFGIKLVLVGGALFFDKEFEFGSLSNPIKKYRDKAYDRLLNMLKFTKKVDANVACIWPGIDGYTYPLGNNFYQMWEFFEEAVSSALDEVPGVQVVIEPKPYEPAPNNIYRTTSDGILAARDIEARLKSEENVNILKEGKVIVGLNPEIGHIRMGFEDVAYTFARVAREGRLLHTHWNSQPLGNYDQDLNVGVVGWEQAEAGLFVLKMVGYRGYFGIDINPERMPVEKAIEINAKVLNVMNDRINRVPYEKILDCYYEPEKNRGVLEMILAEARK